MISLKNLLIFVGGALLYFSVTAFLYVSVFSSHKFERNNLEKAGRNRTKGAETKDPFLEYLPTKVERVSINQFLGSVPLHQMNSIQTGQCDGTRGNAVGGMPKLNECDDWPNFSPSSFSTEHDFIEWRNNNTDYWKRVSHGLDGEELNLEKLKMNELGFTLNGHLKPKNGHLPIWIKTYKRRKPLDVSLASICHIDDIADTILFVTIDGGDFDGVIEELLNVKCVKVKIYFHPFLSDLKNLGLDKRDRSVALVLNSHYVYGLYMLIMKLDYPYVITLEDDLEASPDFYRYHYSLYHMVYGKNATYYDNKRIFAIAAYTHGPIVDCHFIVPKLNNETGKCGIDEVHQLVEENYFPGWGSGVVRSSFLEYWSVWKHNENIYDFGMTLLRGDGARLTLVPCSPRVRTIVNNGVNGGNSGRWDHYLSTFAKWGEKPLDRVYYVDRRDGVVQPDVKSRFMYNKVV